MKRTILITLAVIAVAMPVFSEKQMSRADVLKYAFENSNELAQLKAEREKTEYMRKEYYGKALPDINGAINYVFAPDLNDTKTNPSFSSMLNDIGDDPSDYDKLLAGGMDGISNALGSMSAKNTLQWEVSLTQPIFAQGKVRTGLKIADIALETIDVQYKDAQFSLAQSIVDAYNSALLAQQNMIIQQDALAISQESHRLCVARFNAGNGSALDTLNTRFAVQQAILNLRDAEKGQRLSIKSLANAASMEDSDFSLSDSLTIPEFNISEETAWDEMQKNNTSLKLLNYSKDLQSEQTHLAKTDYRPIVAAFANIGQHNLFDKGKEFSEDDAWQWSSQVGLGIQVPIFNGGQRRSKLHQAKLEELKLDKQEIDARNGLRLALSAAFEDLAVAREELSQSEQMLALTEQGLKISRLSFELGQLTQLELNNTEQNYKSAKLAQNNAVYKINSAVVNIEKLIGNEKLITLGN